jgi:hypothetical protein
LRKASRPQSTYFPSFRHLYVAPSVQPCRTCCLLILSLCMMTLSESVTHSCDPSHSRSRNVTRILLRYKHICLAHSQSPRANIFVAILSFRREAYRPMSGTAHCPFATRLWFAIPDPRARPRSKLSRSLATTNFAFALVHTTAYIRTFRDAARQQRREMAAWGNLGRRCDRHAGVSEPDCRQCRLCSRIMASNSLH